MRGEAAVRRSDLIMLDLRVSHHVFLLAPPCSCTSAILQRSKFVLRTNQPQRIDGAGLLLLISSGPSQTIYAD